ncbi:MAG: hypothetical protein ACYC33_11910 [Thermoleophilia bacterium]
MNLAEYMVFATVFVFGVGASVALAWFLASGQWHGRAAGARVVLDDDATPDNAAAKEV